VIITRTPLRISFAGGGSDLPAFFADEPGMVVSATIDRFVCLTVTTKYDGAVRVSYSQTENVDCARDVFHPLVREALALADIRRGVEIVSVADLPSGTGLGSSSAFTVGLLLALAAHQGRFTTAEQLATDACTVEIGRCQAPIGKQDQYAAAYGGLRAYTFHPDGGVGAEALALVGDARAAFESHLLLLDTGRRHNASVLLAGQSAAMRDSRKRATIRAMANLAATFRDALLSGNLRECGDLLDAAWRLKRNVVQGITDDPIDNWYSAALRAGAWGGKLCGAGGGGFLLLLAPPERHAAIARAVGLRALPVRLSDAGASVIYSGGA
jgi:D-glycero-alpha-D-manno-heptose-7-phosphate kinase